METLNGPMGPIFNGGFDERYLFHTSSQTHAEVKLTVPSFEQTNQTSVWKGQLACLPTFLFLRISFELPRNTVKVMRHHMIPYILSIINILHD